MTDVPLRLHFVWTGARFPYHARLAIESAIVALPEALVDLDVVGTLPNGRHFDVVARRDQVRVERWSPGSLFEPLPAGARPYHDLYARLPAGSAAAVSNLARLAILFQRGGVYLDTDVIVLRGLHSPDTHGAYVGLERVWTANRDRVARGLGPLAAIRATPWAARWAACRLDLLATQGRLGLADRIRNDGTTRLQVNNAVIGAPTQSEFIAVALAQALEVDPSVRFALGPSLLDDVATACPRLVNVVPSSRFYAVPPGESDRLFHDRTLQLPCDAQVMHYVASNHRRLLDRLDIDDPRFEHGAAPFWKHARRVRAAIGAGRPHIAIDGIGAVGTAGTVGTG